jgi:hypothetical protein
MTPLTEDQIVAQTTQAAGGALIPEWTDHKGARQLFGFSRSHLYSLIEERKIRSACIRRRGAIRGRRLVNCQSIRDFLAKCESETGEANIE